MFKKRLLVRLLLALALTGAVAINATPAQADGAAGCTSPWWPTSGAVSTTTSGTITTATFAFVLTPGELANLQCVAPLLEIDFHLEGVQVPPQWDDYIVYSTNLPGAMHDVAAGDFNSSTPGVTGIYVRGDGGLHAGHNYWVTLAWQQLPALSGQAPGFWIGWVPSHIVDFSDPWDEVYCAVAPYDWRGQAWCVFPTDALNATAYLRAGSIGINQLNFGGNSVHTFGSWPTSPFPPDVPLLPAISSSFNFAAYLQPVPSRQMFLRGDSAVFAKDSFGDGGWTQETDPGSINKIAAGGGNQLVLNACNAVYARTTIGNAGWIQETPCGGAKAIAVSNTGLRMLIDANDAVWAKYGMGYGGWTKETDDNTAYAIAAGGDTQVIITACRAIYAKTGIGMGGWNHEVGCGNANAIAVDNTGLQAFIRGDAAVFAKRGIGDGGWQQQVGPGNAGAIAAGGGVLMFLRGDSAVFAKTNIGIDGGWTQETAPGTANLIDVGDNGRQMIRTGDNAVWAKDGIGHGGWVTQVGGGNATAIAIG